MRRIQSAVAVAVMAAAMGCTEPQPTPDAGTADAGSTTADAGLVVASLTGGLEGFDLAAVIQEGYWYSRYNLGSFVMMSGIGSTFAPPQAMAQMMADMASDPRSTAMLPGNPALLVTTDEDRDHFHRCHRGPRDHPVVGGRFFAQADSAGCAQGLSARR